MHHPQPITATKTTKDRIIEAAMGIARTKGARHLTIDAVTVQSGLSKGGVLYHFPSKKALLKGLVAYMIVTMGGYIDAHYQRFQSGPNPTLHALAALLGDLLDGRLGVPVALLAAGAEDPDLLEPAREEICKIWQKIESETADVPRALVIWSAIEGVHYMDLLGMAPAEGRTLLRKCLTQLELMIEDLPPKECKT
ncbi:hypothetical protein JI58_03230 [Marinosulfonomonas sp. PRT-SC04]|nr:hypothetical protein JI58_03230 [Marinosulfonomonas sp. PRT-SC04]